MKNYNKIKAVLLKIMYKILKAINLRLFYIVKNNNLIVNKKKCHIMILVN